MSALEPGIPVADGLADAETAANGNVETGYLITRLHGLLRRKMDDSLRELDLNTAQYVVLRELGSVKALSAAELARRTYVRPQAVAPLITALERQGLVERSPHRQLRRVIEVRITPKGRGLLAQAGKRCQAVELQLLDSVGSADQERLREILQVCLANMDPPWYGQDGSTR